MNERIVISKKFSSHDIISHASIHSSCIPHTSDSHKSFNSLTPGRGGNNFEIITFELIFWIDILKNSYEIVLWRMPRHQILDKLTLVQVMAWCCQATSHYLSQCWPSFLRFLSPHGVTRPQWVNRHLCHIHAPCSSWSICLYFESRVF